VIGGESNLSPDPNGRNRLRSPPAVFRFNYNTVFAGLRWKGFHHARVRLILIARATEAAMLIARTA